MMTCAREYSGSCSPTGSHSSGSSIPPTLEGVSEEAPVSEDDERPNSPSAEDTNSKAKLNARKNPWGNHSYAELIAQVKEMAMTKNFILIFSRRSRVPRRVG